MPQEDNYWKRAMRKRISRRDMLRGTAWAGIGLAGVGLIGCNPEQKASPTNTVAPPVKTTAPGATSAPAATPVPTKVIPKTGGTFKTFSTDIEPYTMDLHMNNVPHASMVLPFSRLITWTTAHDTPQPDGAESWEVSPDGRTYTFHLRKGMKFHNIPPVNGREVTAEDWVYSFKRGATDKPAFVKNYLFKPITKLEAVDKYTLVVGTDQPFAPMLEYLGNNWAGVIPKELSDDQLKNTVIGTGPFMLKEYEHSVVYKLRKNPDYWDKTLPYLAGIDINVIPDDAARVAAFRAGSLDHYGGGTYIGVQDILKSKPEAVKVSQLGQAYNAIRFNTTKPPFNDVRLRKAVNLAIDRQELIKLVHLDQGVVSDAFVTPMNSVYALSADEMSKRPGFRQPKDQDIAEAKQLVKDAGAEGLKFEMLNWAVLKDYSPLIKAQLAKIGLDASMRDMEYAEWKPLSQKLDYTITVAQNSTRDDIDEYLYGYYHSKGAANITGYKNPPYDALVEKQRTIVDVKERAKVVAQAREMLYQDLPSCGLVEQVANEVVQPYVKDYQLGKPPSFGQYLWAKVWLNK